jgi:hypothetical protein
MLLLLAVLLGIGVGLASGGRLGNLAAVRFRWPYLVIAALLIRELVLFKPFNRVAGIQFVYVIALAAVAVWTLWHLDRLRGVWLVTIGVTLNLIVVLANGGHMPVAPSLAGSLVQRGTIGQYTLMGPGTNLNWLGDWISWPGPMGAVFGEAYSPGDLFVAVGVAVVVIFATRHRASADTKLDETSGRIGSYPP